MEVVTVCNCERSIRKRRAGDGIVFDTEYITIGGHYTYFFRILKSQGTPSSRHRRSMSAAADCRVASRDEDGPERRGVRFVAWPSPIMAPRPM